MSGQQESLSRDLSLFDITMIGVGAMIGAGIFVLTGEAAGRAGPALVLAFALNGIVTLLTAMVYAELGSAIPEAGGGYLWIKEGLPGSNAFLAGWMSWFAHAVAGALYALGFGAFLFETLRLLDIPLLAWGIDLVLAKKLFGVAIALLFAVINFRGASETGKAGNIVTVAKIVVIGVFCLFGIKFMFAPDAIFRVGEAAGGMGISQLSPFIPEETGWMGILAAMGITFIAFEGYEIIVQAGEEVKDPRRNIPKAIFRSLVIVIPIYMVVAFVLIGGAESGLLLRALASIGMEVPEGLTAASPNWKVLAHVGELGLAQAAGQFVPLGTLLILAGGMLSTMSALNATTFSSTRVAFAMGRDRNLPEAFARIHPRNRTPYVALAGTAVLIAGMVAFVPITTVAAAADIMFLLLFFQVNVAAITIRKKYGDKLAYGYLMPFFPVLPLVAMTGMGVIAVMMFFHYQTAWFYALAWIAAGLVVYRLYARGREREKTAPPVVAEERPFEVRPNAVLIPVAEPRAALQHIELGARIARLRESQLVLLHVVPIPRQLPPRSAQHLVEAARPLLDRGREHAAGLGVPASTLIRVGHDVAGAVVRTAEDRHTDFLIMGWKGRERRRGFLIGRHIDRVLKGANTHIIVMQRGAFKKGERVLVPIANPRTAPLALAVGALIAGEEGGGSIQVIHMTPQETDPDYRTRFEADLTGFLRQEGWDPGSLFGDRTRFGLEFRTTDNVVTEIIRLSADYDRLVLGTSQGGVLQRKIYGRIPTRIARYARCPVVLVRMKESGVLFGLQHFFQFFRELESSGQPESAGEV